MHTQPLTIPKRTAPPLAMRTLYTHHIAEPGRPPGHDRQSRIALARRLADIMGWTFGGDLSDDIEPSFRAYLVPHDALLRADADALGIRGADDVYGGVVPHAFIATKSITHPLIDRYAAAPAGWSHAFARWAGDSVLRGYTAFSRADAVIAATLLLRHGPVRVKAVSGIGGSGQTLVRDGSELDAALDTIDATELERDGVAVEEHLEDNVTFSVGCVECNGERIAYCGTQRTVVNPHGHEVYGGSTLDVVRGGFDTLAGSDLPAGRREAVELASRYDAAAFAAYPDAFASRRNYDVLTGRDGSGVRRSGVLEQSWRIGGASGAELVAFDAFRRDPLRARIRCATVEVYDEQCPVPPGAFVYYRGVDPVVGGLTKYALEIDGLPHT